jgi:hypothetical protein
MQSFHAMILFSIILAAGTAGAQCCSEPGIEFDYTRSTVSISLPTTWDSDRLVNGSLVVESELLVIDCSLEIEGEGIAIRPGGILTLVNSTINPSISDAGFYIESSGSLNITGSSIEGCLDTANGYFGIYLKQGNLSMKGTSMTRSGLIQSGIDSAVIINSEIPGIIATSGNVTVIRSSVGGMGTSLVGNGKLELEDTRIDSNISFSNSIAAISCEGGSLVARNLTLNGTYGGGIYADESNLAMEDIKIILPYSQYGVRAIRSSASSISGVSVSGSDEGMKFDQCQGNQFMENISIMGSNRGFQYSGPGFLEIDGIMISNSSYGMVLEGHARLRNSTIEETVIGLILESEGNLVEADCIISDFTGWGVQVESWEEPDLDGIVFKSGENARSNISMWGRINIGVKGPGGEDIEGADIDIESELGKMSGLESGEINLVWGYLDSSETIRKVRYQISARWGNAHGNHSFEVNKDEDLDIILPMTDISIIDLSRNGDEASITVVANGSRANDVRLTLYLDGSYRFSRKLSLEDVGEEVTVEMPIGKLDEGTYELSVTAASNDEYSGMNGILLQNNEFTIEIKEEGDTGDNSLQIAAIVLAVVAALLLIVTLLLRRRD